MASPLRERAGAFTDRYNSAEGTECEIFPGGIVERDEYGSVINSGAPTITATAYPLRYNPTDKQLVDVGIKETVDAIAYYRPDVVPYETIQTETVTKTKIKTETARVIVGKETFRVSSKHKKDLDGLWTVLGLIRT